MFFIRRFKFLRKIFVKFSLLYLSYWVQYIKYERKILPRNFVRKMFFIYKNYNNVSIQFNSKIILPYIDVNLVNQTNINRPYEILPVSIIPKNEKTSININSTRNVIVPIAVLDINGRAIGNDKINFTFGERCVPLEIKFKNRFHYLPLRSKKQFNKFNIRSDRRELAVGKPIYRN